MAFFCSKLIGWELLLIFYLMALGSRKAGSLMEGFISSLAVGLENISSEYSVVDSLIRRVSYRHKLNPEDYQNYGTAIWIST